MYEYFTGAGGAFLLYNCACANGIRLGRLLISPVIWIYLEMAQKAA
jgi:hypothetical protein